MNSGESGSFNRLRYDTCAYEKELYQSTSQLGYRLSMDPYENENKCVADKNSFYHPYDDKIIEASSELRGLNRKGSKCAQNRYNPNCEKSDSCMSTFDPSVAIVLAPEVCPIIQNNLQKMTGPGYELDIKQ